MDAPRSMPLGAEVVARAPSRRHAKTEVVLCHLAENTVTPWVTWIVSPVDGGCHWGHYHRVESDALADFAERASSVRPPVSA